MAAVGGRFEDLKLGFVMKIVIVGGGFGGIRAALDLAGYEPFKVTLISDISYFEYHAALYRSATGRSPLEVAVPLSDFFHGAKNIEVVEDKVTEFDVAGKTVKGESGSTWQYDSLILAAGSVTNYFGIKGLETYSYGVKSINQVLELKRHLHDSLVAGHEEQNYVVVGAGATGVELAGELSAYLKRIRRLHRLGQNYTIHLIEAADKILPQLSRRFTGPLERRLKKLDVKLQLGTPILAETYEGIQLPGQTISSHTVIWTAGMTTNPLLAYNDQLKFTERHKVKVSKFLNGAESVYVIGDSADTKYSGMAQTALHDAKFVTANLKRQLAGKSPKAYKPARPVYAIPVGPHWSGVTWRKVRLYGYAGWVLRRLADLRLYLKFLPPAKALTVWRYGITVEEECETCGR